MNKQDTYAFENFDRSPNLMRVSVRVVAKIAGTSTNTIWRKVREGVFPEPSREGRQTSWTVGQVRAWLAGATAQQVAEAVGAEAVKVGKTAGLVTAKEAETC